MADRLFENMPLAPVDLPTTFEELEEPLAAPRWSPPTPAVRPPSYGLVGVPSSTVTTKDVKTFTLGATIGAAIVALFSWFGRRG